MGTMARLGKILIRVNGREHLPAHFHVITPDAEALLSIKAPFAMIEGELPAKTLEIARQWAADHQTELTAEWNAWNPQLDME